MRQIRDRAQRELDRLDEIWTTFTKGLAPKRLIVDENLYRELVDRYGEYFDRSHGRRGRSEAIENFDIDAEAEALREIIRSGKGQKKPRAQAAQGRRRVPAVRQLADGHGARRRPGDPAGLRRWFSSTVAGSRPPT